MQPMKTLLIILCTTTFVFAQEEPKVLFQTQDIKNYLATAIPTFIFFSSFFPWKIMVGLWLSLNVLSFKLA